jgi:aminopeptidase N
MTAEEKMARQRALARSDSFNIIHYDIHADLTDFGSGIFQGLTRIDFRPKMDSLDRIQFDFEGLTTERVWSAQSDSLSFFAGDATLTVFPSNPFLKDSLYSLWFEYAGQPITCPSGFGGFYFEDGYAYNLGIGLQAKPHNFGRAWYPCFDNFVERATYTFRITTHQGRKGYGVGSFIEEINEGGDTLTRVYEMMQDIPTYLSHIAASEYEEINYMHQGQYGAIPIQLIARGPDVSDTRTSFEPLADAIDCMEDWYGPYPYERIGYTITTRGAMEHPTAVAYPRSSILGGDSNLGLITHELGHHWWGNITTLKTENDMWIKEGPASYAEHQIVEYREGPKAFQEVVRGNNINMLLTAHISDGDFLALSPMADEQIYGRHTYDKGAAMIHNLRGYLGDDLFRSGMQHVLEARPFEAISGSEFRDELIAGTGYDLTDFFDDWIFSPGWSDFYVNQWTATDEDTLVRIELDIRQGVYGTENLHDNVPVTVGFYHSEHPLQEFKVQASGTQTSGSFDLNFMPEHVFINPNQRLNLASASYFEALQPPFQQNFTGTNWVFNAGTFSGDSLPLQLTHHMVAPPGQEQDDRFRISSNHFWSVWTPENLTNTETLISYQGRNENQFDYDLVRVNDDSLILVYRSFADTHWMEYPHYTKNIQLPGDNRGICVLNQILPGFYAFANRKSTSSAADNQSTVKNILYPIPSTDLIYLQTETAADEYQVINGRGAIVNSGPLPMSRGPYELNISNLASGFYYLHWKDQSGKWHSKKFFKQE